MTLRRALQTAKSYAVVVLTAACCTAALYLLIDSLPALGFLHMHDHTCEESSK